MGRKSQSKHSGKEKVDKQRVRRVKQLFGLAEQILRLTTDIGTGVDPLARHETMMGLLEQVRSLERTSEPVHTKGKRIENITTFTNWLKENGAQFEGVEIAEFEGYELGLRAMREFPQESLVLTVPRRLMLTDEDADKSSLAPHIHNDPIISTMPNVALALFLLLEKNNPESFWKPYLDMLPESYSTVLYFTTEELKELKPSPVFEQALKLCRSIVRQYAYIYTKIHTHPSGAHPLAHFFTYDAYRWAVCTVMTRQNSVAGRVCFIPLWDMCNHEDGKITTDYNAEEERSECYALRDFPAGDQIMIFYGVRTNAELFLHNGFVCLENEQDSVTVHLGVSEHDALCAARRALLSRLGLGARSQYEVYYVPPHSSAQWTPFTPDVMAFASVISMTPDELSKVSADERVCALTTWVCDPAVERRALSFLRMRCWLLARAYTHTETQDATLSLHRRNVNLLKQTELKILTSATAYADRILNAPAEALGAQ